MKHYPGSKTYITCDGLTGFGDETYAPCDEQKKGHGPSLSIPGKRVYNSYSLDNWGREEKLQMAT